MAAACFHFPINVIKVNSDTRNPLIISRAVTRCSFTSAYKINHISSLGRIFTFSSPTLITKAGTLNAPRCELGLLITLNGDAFTVRFLSLMAQQRLKRCVLVRFRLRVCSNLTRANGQAEPGGGDRDALPSRVLSLLRQAEATAPSTVCTAHFFPFCAGKTARLSRRVRETSRRRLRGHARPRSRLRSRV